MNTSSPPGTPTQDGHDALPPGTRLRGEFEILRVLGIGGFGIVYLAMDHALERLVALKEYMPTMMAGRGRGSQVSVRASAHQETFDLGLRSFVNEAKLLARFNHPSLVKVYQFWEANGTAYMAMPYYAGRTLRDERRSMHQAPSETWLRELVDPLLGAMEVLHRENVYHRDIAPDNILLLADGPPVLLDFGAARSVIGDHTQSLTAVLKPSYAPIEQYANVGHLRQGAWTDLYALGAVLHFVVMGRPPSPSASRAIHDEQPLLHTLGPEHTGAMPAKILRAIDWALTVHPHTRPQSVQEFRDALDGRLLPLEPTTVMQRTVPQARPSSDEVVTVQTAPLDSSPPLVGEGLASPPVVASASSGPPWGQVNLGSGPAIDLRGEGAAAAKKSATPARKSRPRLLTLGTLGTLALAALTCLVYVALQPQQREIAPPTALPTALPTASPSPTASAAASTSVPAVAVPDWSASTPPNPSIPAVLAASAPLPIQPAPKPRTNPRVPKHPSDPLTVPRGPTVREACNARTSGSLSGCMRRLCRQAAWTEHPQCVEIRQSDEW
jgi:serine/threonine protein kinase